MYESYWGLREKPFENIADPRFLYHSQEHEEALMRLIYAVREQKGGVILVGEYGTGKTTLGNALLEELTDPERYTVIFITNPLLSSTQFLREIVYKLNGGSTPRAKPELLRLLENTLLRKEKDNKKVIIIIDEAHLISKREVFEELRLLLNYQLNGRFLLTLIFLGQPELKSKINRIKQLKQRLAIRYYLNPLNRDEVREYIRYRMKVAGREEEIFTEEAVDLVFVKSGGSPRSINNICDMSLLIGFSKKVDRIDKDIVYGVVKDLQEAFE